MDSATMPRDSDAVSRAVSEQKLIVSWQHPTTRAIEPVGILSFDGAVYRFDPRKRHSPSLPNSVDHRGRRVSDLHRARFQRLTYSCVPPTGHFSDEQFNTPG